MDDEVRISTVGMNCPKPLIETRKAMRRMQKGQLLVIEGDHALSKDEIPQAMRDTGDEVVAVRDVGPRWVITVRKG